MLTTQYLDEADQLSDRIAVIDHGRIIAEGTPGELKSSVGSGALRVQLADAGIVGGLLGDLGRYLLATLLVLGMGLLMGYRPAGGGGGAAAAVALALIFAFSISWIWTTLGLVLRSAQTVTVLSFAVQFPLTFASNVYVRPATMPGWLRAFVDANPVSHLVTTERALMNGTATAGQVGGVLLVATALIAVFGPLTMHLYRTRQ